MRVQYSSHCHVDQMCGDGKGKPQYLSLNQSLYYLSQEKCAQYWPERPQHKCSGNKFTVTLISTMSYMEYCIRCFEIQNVSDPYTTTSLSVCVCAFHLQADSGYRKQLNESHSVPLHCMARPWCTS